MSTAPSVISADALEALLTQLRESDSERIRQAEAVLKKCLAQPHFMIDLLSRLHASQAAESRQLAAVLMRRRLGGHWRKLDVGVQGQMKVALLERLTNEPVSIVRSSTADLVCVIARQALPASEWPELLAYIAQCARSDSADHRAISMQLIGSLLESEEVVGVLQPHFGTLAEMLGSALGEPPPSPVPRAALKALSSWAQTLEAGEGDDEQASFTVLKPLIPLAMQVCAAAASTADDETVRLGCLMLDDLVESSPNLAKAQLAPLLELSLLAAEAKPLEVESRGCALQLAQTLLNARGKQVGKERLVGALVLRLFEIACEGDVEEEEEGEASMHTLASQALETVAERVSSKQMIPAVVSLIEQHHAAPPASRRRAVLVLMTVAARGCAEPFAKLLRQVLPVVYAACAAPEPAVREAACLAVGMFAQTLHPEILEHSAQILPALFGALQGTDPGTGGTQLQQKACYALESFCEHLGEDIIPFLPRLVEMLSLLVQCPHRRTQERAASALASVANAAEGRFVAHFEGVHALMAVLLQQRGEGELLLRARAMECLGIMFLAVGRENCAHVLPTATERAFEGLSLGEPELREYTFGFFAALAELLGVELAPLLPRLLPALKESLRSDDAFDFVDAGGGDESDDDEGGGQSVHVRTAMLDEKAAAAHCVGACAEHLGALFAEAVPTLLPPLLGLHDYFHEDVRGSVLRALAHVTCAVDAAERRGVADGTEASELLPPAQNAAAILKQVLPPLREHFLDDEDKDTVAAASEAIAQLVLKLGPHALPSALVDELTAAAVALLEQRHNCQKTSEELWPDEDDDHDEVLWEALSELLTTLPKAFKSHWQRHFVQILHSLLPYLREGHPPSDHTMAIGIIAESLLHLGEAGAKMFPQVLPHALRCSAAEDPICRQNSVFCLGVLGHHGGDAAIAQMQSILSALQPRLDEAEEEAVRDNAVGALARLAMAHTSSLPLEQILPAITSRFPLKADAGENTPVLRCLMQASVNPACQALMGPLIPTLLSACGQALVTPPALPPAKTQPLLERGKVRDELRSYLQWLRAQGPQLEQMLLELPETERAPLLELLSGG